MVIIMKLAISCALVKCGYILGALLICSGAEVSDSSKSSVKLRPQS